MCFDFLLFKRFPLIQVPGMEAMVTEATRRQQAIVSVFHLKFGTASICWGCETRTGLHRAVLRLCGSPLKGFSFLSEK